jgi:hypothetical protein
MKVIPTYLEVMDLKTVRVICSQASSLKRRRAKGGRRGTWI